MCCIDACVCIDLIVHVRGRAQPDIPPPGSVAVPSLWHYILGVVGTPELEGTQKVSNNQNYCFPVHQVTSCMF